MRPTPAEIRLAAELERLTRERDEARADSAALLAVVRMQQESGPDGSCSECGYIGHHKSACAIGRAARGDHPGSALLREVQALRRVRDQLRDDVSGGSIVLVDECRALSDACAEADRERQA